MKKKLYSLWNQMSLISQIFLGEKQKVQFFALLRAALHDCSLCLLLVWTHLFKAFLKPAFFSCRYFRRPFFWWPRGYAHTNNCVWMYLFKDISLYPGIGQHTSLCTQGEAGFVFWIFVQGTGYEAELTPKPVENHRIVSIHSTGLWHQLREQNVCSVGRDW